MIPKGQLGSGLILVFNNGLKNLHRYRRSAVMAIDPVGKGVPWRYDNRFFYSSIAGTAEPLPNGNVLISSSQGGRVFEITPDREIVWQWTPPYHPMRPERYPWDHCPQLAGLDSVFFQLPPESARRDPQNSCGAGLVTAHFGENIHDVLTLHGSQSPLRRGRNVASPRDDVIG